MFLRKVCLGLVFMVVALYPSTSDIYAQRQQVNYQADLFFAGATEDTLPFWSAANQFGILDSASPNGILRFSTQYPGILGDNVSYELGVDWVGRTGDQSTVFFQQ